MGRRALLGLAVVLPFERSLVDIPALVTVTTVEVAALVALAVAGAAIALGCMSLQRPSWWIPGTVLLAVFAVAALAAPSERGNALRLVGRLGVAAAVIVATATLITRVEQARRLVAIMLVPAVLVAVLALLEVAQVSVVTSLLTTFRPGFHLVAGQLRATGPLMYPTIASMYLEVAFALGLWLLLDPARGRVARLGVLAALSLVGAGITATFTRAGLIGMGAALAVTGVMIHARLGLDRRQVRRLASLAAAIVASIFLLHSPERLAARLSTEGSQAWYGVVYDVPSTLSLATGGVQRVPVVLTNTGRLTWDSDREPRFLLSYHWLRAGSDEVVQFEGQRTGFAAPVAPGRTVTLLADVIAPAAPGEYRLIWDVVHEHRAWLSTEGVTPAETLARVAGPRVPEARTGLTRLPAAAARPDRPALWRAALALAADRPVLGVGPDNFRLMYGTPLGLPDADPRVHANNMYLEALTGAGVCGLAALLWMFAASGRALVARCRTSPPDGVVPAAAMLSAWLMVAGHGLVDSFLSFTTTYLTFALAAGLAFADAFVNPHPSTCAPVHRTAPIAPDAPDAPGHAHRL